MAMHPWRSPSWYGWIKPEAAHATPTGLCQRCSEASAWVLARLEDKGCSLELRCLNTKHATHGNKVELTWR